jgi:hypothetical protein
MRPRRAGRGTRFGPVAGGAAIAALALVGCSGTPDCGPSERSRTVTVHAVKPGVAAVQCWSGCEPGARDLEPAAGAGQRTWSVHLADDEPASVTLAARDPEGDLLYAERFRLEWAGCPAAPTRTELELLRPEAGS